MAPLKGWEEIEPVPEQKKQFLELRENFKAKTRELVRETVDPKSGWVRVSRRRKLIAAIQELHEDYSRDAFKIFLPHQIKNWKQMQLQKLFRSSAYLAFSRLSDELGLSIKQLSEVKEIEIYSSREIEKIRNPWKQESLDLKTDARSELLKILTKEQISKCESFTGRQIKN